MTSKNYEIVGSEYSVMLLGEDKCGSRYFTVKELADPLTKQVRLHPGWMRLVSQFREAIDMPMIVTSACRSEEYNEAVRGHPRSLHLMYNPHHPTQGTMAMDFSIANLKDIYIPKLIEKARKLSISIGVDKRRKFCHIDGRILIGLPRVEWEY